MALPYRDRTDAGTQLAGELASYAGGDAVVLGLPRGGVPVAAEVARQLGLPLDVFIVRKLGTPGHPELAMGAVATGGVRVLNDRVIAAAGVTDDQLERVTEAELTEIKRREEAYRGDRPPARIEGRTIILVDDGLATGSTMRAAVDAVRQQNPAQTVVAVPVAAPEVVAAFATLVDDVVCPAQPPDFRAVGYWYDDFSQTADDEVRALLDGGGG